MVQQKTLFVDASKSIPTLSCGCEYLMDIFSHIVLNIVMRLIEFIKNEAKYQNRGFIVESVEEFKNEFEIEIPMHKLRQFEMMMDKANKR